MHILMTLIAAAVLSTSPSAEDDIIILSDAETASFTDTAYYSVFPVSIPQKESLPKKPNELIKSVAATYGVPAGLLYGIWMTETRGLTKPWGESGVWKRASSLLATKGPCVKRYGYSFCMEQWRALSWICDQTQNDGTSLCNPRRVFTSYAYAMGPMQHLPGGVVKVSGDRQWYSWGSRAIDFDQDGVVNPLSLPDAFAMSAQMLRRDYEYARAESAPRYDRAKQHLSATKRREMRRGQFHAAWRYATARYFGASTRSYQKSVQKAWRDWCRKEKATCDYGEFR